MATQTLKWENVSRVLNEFGREFVEVYRNRLASDNVNTTQASLSKSVRHYEVRGSNWIAIDIELLDRKSVV